MAIGVPYDLFWHLTPKKLESFEKAYKLKREIEDENNWYLGLYFYRASYASVRNAILNIMGKQGDTDYLDKPITQEHYGSDNDYLESKEEVAVFEAKQRIKILEKQGLPQSPM